MQRSQLALLLLCTTLLCTACTKSKPSSQVNTEENSSIARKPRTLEPTQDIILGATTLHVAVARTAEEQAQGLSGIPSLSEDQGMLFPFHPSLATTFWMKDMRVPIDIIWIQNGLVVGTSHNLPPAQIGAPERDMTLYPSPGKIDYALEVAAGWSARHGINTGTKFQVK